MDNITATGNNVGGIIGNGVRSRIIASYAAGGAVSGGANVGGLVGAAVASNIIASYNSGGDVSGTDTAGGLIGNLGIGDDVTNVTSSYRVDSIQVMADNNAITTIDNEVLSINDLQSPQEFSGIYADWGNYWCNAANGAFITNSGNPRATDDNRAWNLGSSTQLPVLTCTAGGFLPQRRER